MKMSEDISGFTGCLSSTESNFSDENFQTDDDDSSAGQDGFNEVDEVVVRFKAKARGPDFVNEAFEDSEDNFIGTLDDSDEERKYESFQFQNQTSKAGPSIYSNHVG